MPVTCRKIGKKFRIVGPNGRIEKTGKGNATDGGGHPTRGACGLQARAINTNVENVKQPKRTKIVPSNPLKADPTRSKTLRDQFTREITKRFTVVKGNVNRLIIIEDAFGLKRINQPLGNEENEDGDREKDSEATHNPDKSNDRRTIGENLGSNNTSRLYNYLRTVGAENEVRNTRFAFQSDPNKVEEFRKWLQTQFSIIVPPNAGERLENQWWTQFVEEGYRKGAGRAFDDTRVAQRALAGTPEQEAFFQGTREEFLRSSFGKPETIAKIKSLSGRMFTELKGITDEMSKVLTRELAQGLARGENPLVIARTINKAIDKIGAAKARVIARTEIVRAHAEGQLDALETLGVTEVGVMVEWSTAGDDRVCPLCAPLDGVVLKLREARGIIPRHPMCRCSWIPANVGESPKGQKRTEPQIDKAFDKSIKAESDARSLADQKKKSKWLGTDKTIAKTRPESIIEPAKPVRKPTPKKRVITPKPQPKVTKPKVTKKPTPKVTKRVVTKKPVKQPIKKKPVTQEPELKKSLSKAEREIQNLPNERSYIFDKNGKVLDITNGTEDTITLSLENIKQSKGNITLHNHTAFSDGTVSSFSRADIQGSIQRAEFSTHVITQKGHRVAMSYKDTLKDLTSDQRRKLARKVVKSYDKEVKVQAQKWMRKSVRGEITRQEAVFQVSNSTWENVAKKFNLDYKVKFP